MGRVLEGCKPQNVFYYFEEICKIPHGSYHVEAISDYLVAFAKEHQLEVLQDDAYNVLIKKPASIGMEQAPTILLQGHMDMVCEKESGVDFDFLTEPLRLEVDGDDVRAKGTTLGGDDGIALAYGLAILADDTLVHPALEVLFTTQEETGMEGAFAFDMSKISADYLINLDSEEEGTVLTSCAGGVTVHTVYPAAYEKAEGSFYEITVHGLTGGHSGADSHYGRANANIVMGQLLYVCRSVGIPYGLAVLEGGTKNNAIAREARAVICIDEKYLASVQIVLKDFVTRTAQEFAEREPNLAIDFKPVEPPCDQVLCSYTRDAVADLLAHISDGVCKMSEDVKGLVETSGNLGVLCLKEDGVHLEFLLRSSVEKELDNLLDVITFCIRSRSEKLAQEETKALLPVITTSDRYPGWQYKKDSKLRALLLSAYENQYHAPMKVEAIHAGLECGIFASQKDLDIVSIGPDILDIHTPKETLKIASTKRTYELVLEVLARAKELG